MEAIAAMKLKANEIAETIKDPKDNAAYEKARDALKKVSLMEMKK
jgi:hypothetical protein